MSTKKIHAFSLALFFLGLAGVTLFDAWWPSIMLVIGIPLAIRSYLLGKTGEMLWFLVIFVGIFLAVQVPLSSKILLPSLFACLGLYLFGKGFFTRGKE